MKLTFTLTKITCEKFYTFKMTNDVLDNTAVVRSGPDATLQVEVNDNDVKFRDDGLSENAFKKFLSDNLKQQCVEKKYSISKGILTESREDKFKKVCSFMRDEMSKHCQTIGITVMSDANSELAAGSVCSIQ